MDDRVQQMLNDMFQDKSMPEEEMIDALLDDMEYIRQKFVAFQQDVYNNTLIGYNMQEAMWDFADYCITILRILRDDTEDNREDIKQWKNIILKQAYQTMLNSSNR